MSDFDDSLSGDETEEEKDEAPSSQKSRFSSCSRLIIFNFFKNRNKRGGIRTQPFALGGYVWNLYYFPKGTESEPKKFSLFIEIADEVNRPAFFRLTCKNHVEKEDHSCDASHNFCPKNPDWGFASFLTQENVLDSSKGYLSANGEMHILVELGFPPRVLKSSLSRQIRHGFIQNHGSSSLYSLLQALFHLPYFRLAVFQIPDLLDDDDSSLPFSLQLFFSRLQTNRASSPPIDPKHLSSLFGTTSKENVQEFNRILLSSLQQAMKGTLVEGTIEKLFRGEIINHTCCLHVPFETESQPEEFYNLLLPLQNCTSIYDSFRKYMLPSTLNGKNRYFTRRFGLQDAIRGVRFKIFPEILQITLDRFQPIKGEGMKTIEGEITFPMVLDVKEFVDSRYRESTIYHLHGVLCLREVYDHYVCIRPTMGPLWFELSKKEGIVHSEGSGFRLGEVFMLIYVRDSCVNDVFRKVGKENIPNSVRKKIKMGEGSIVEVAVVTSDMLREDKQEKFDMLEDLTKVPRVDVKKKMAVREFRKIFAEKNGVDDPEKVLLWDWITRKNTTQRVYSPLLDLDVKFDHMDVYSKSKTPFIRLFAEISDRKQKPFFDTKECVIFFKYFDIENQKLHHIGHATFKRTDLVSTFLPIAKKLASLPENEKVRTYEEVTPTRLDSLLNYSSTLRESELVSGDIIVIEKENQPLSASGTALPRANDFFPQPPPITVQMKPLENPEGAGFPLRIRSDITYLKVAELVGEKVSWPGDKIRLFTSVNPDFMAPINCYQRLSDFMVGSVNQRVYFQKMEMTFREALALMRIGSS